MLASSLADTDRVFREFLRVCERAGPDRCALAGHGPVAPRVKDIAAGATSDQARMLLQEQGTALVCADSPARRPILVIGTRFDPTARDRLPVRPSPLRPRLRPTRPLAVLVAGRGCRPEAAGGG